MSKGKRHLPWVNSSVKRLMNKRNRAYKKACHSGKAVHPTKYKRLRNITTKRLRVTHDEAKKKAMRVLRILLKGISHRAIDRLRYVHTYP